MTEKTDLILEFLAGSGAAHTKKGIQINIELEGEKIGYTTIQRHIERLIDLDLVELAREKGSYYRITEKGERYVQGEYDLED